MKQLFLAFSLVFPVFTFWAYFMSGLNGVLPMLLYSLGKLYLLLAPVVFWRRSLTRGRLRFRQLNKTALMTSLAIGVFFFFSIILIASFLPEEVIAFASKRISEKVSDLGVENHLILLFAFIAVVHSFLEEYYWRVFVYGELRQYQRTSVASVIASLGFTLHHFLLCSHYFGISWGALCAFGVFIAGLVWNYKLERFHSILAPWLSHFFADMAIAYVAFKYFL